MTEARVFHLYQGSLISNITKACIHVSVSKNLCPSRFNFTDLLQYIYNNYQLFCSYTLRCTVMDDWGRVKLAFDLEVCTLPKMPNTGICRKRVKGDTWHYKKLCEDILASCKF